MTATVSPPLPPSYGVPAGFKQGPLRAKYAKEWRCYSCRADATLIQKLENGFIQKVCDDCKATDGVITETELPA